MSRRARTCFARRRLLPGGRAVAIRRSGVGWIWLAWTRLERWNGVADTRAAAMNAALYAGEVC
jgi:hypothetical protein